MTTYYDTNTPLTSTLTIPDLFVASYAYDTRNRLVTLTNGIMATYGFAPDNAVISTGQRATDQRITYGFGYAFTLDGVGNRTQTDLNEPLALGYNAETTNYSYTPGNILASAAGGGSLANGNTYTHDANGNRIQKTASAGTTTYTYDSLNRLAQVVKGPQTTQYIYNGLGQRIGRIDNGVQTSYLIDPNGLLPQVLAETDASNNLISFYVYDGAGLVAKITPSNEYYFYHYDGLGSTIAITDSSAQVVNSYAYSPEGLVGAQETISNPFQYVGRFGVMDEGNGLLFMRARYYDPEVGRFINKDPIGYLGGMNLFAYTNNPVRFIDPYGLFMGQMPPPPPGYDPSTWKTAQWDNGRWVVTSPEGRLYTAHPEDTQHWRHWDKQGPGGKDEGDWPPNPGKRRPGQKKLKKNQCDVDPNGDAPEWTPDLDLMLFFMPLDPINVPIPVRVPLRIPIPAW